MASLHTQHCSQAHGRFSPQLPLKQGSEPVKNLSIAPVCSVDGDSIQGFGWREYYDIQESLCKSIEKIGLQVLDKGLISSVSAGFEVQKNGDLLAKVEITPSFPTNFSAKIQFGSHKHHEVEIENDTPEKVQKTILSLLAEVVKV